MAVHLIKLCVGVGSVEHLAELQELRRTRRQADGGPPELQHVTRMAPRRAGELLDGGSIYWVIRGQIQVRQRLRDLRRFTDAEGISRCALVLDPELVRTRLQPRRPFQGWRYLKPEDAPPDLGPGEAGKVDDMPPEMRAELVNLGLI